MHLAQEGRRDAFAILVSRHQSALLHVAESRLGRRDWAEDVVQETFMAAFKSRKTFDRQASFRTWLWTILLNQCHRHYRRRTRQLLAEHRRSGLPGAQDEEVDVLVSDEATPSAHLLAKERRAVLEKLLTQLSQAQGDALRLRFFGGLKYREIAETMGCSLATAKNRVRWGLLRMGNLIAGEKTSTAQDTKSRGES